MERLAIVDRETGELLEERVLLIGGKPHATDRNFVKVFVAFLTDVVVDREISGGPIRLLLYMIENMSYNDLLVYISPQKVTEDLNIQKQTYHNWKNKLIEKGYIEKVNPYVYKIKPYTAVKGSMRETVGIHG